MSRTSFLLIGALHLTSWSWAQPPAGATPPAGAGPPGQAWLLCGALAAAAVLLFIVEVAVWRRQLSKLRARADQHRQTAAQEQTWEAIARQHAEELSRTEARLEALLAEHQRSGQDLRESQERLRRIIDSSEDFLALHDCEGNFLHYVGPTRFGIAAKDLFGKNVRQVFGDAGERIRAQIRQVAATERDLTAENHLEWQGEALWLQEHVFPVHDDQGILTGVGRVSRNIAGLRRAENALRTSEDRYRAVFNALFEGVMLCGADYRVRECNAAMAELLNMPAERVIGHKLDEFFQDVRWEDGKPVEKMDLPCARALSQKESVADTVLSVLVPGGQRRWLLINTQPLTQPGETKPYAGVISVFDITERKESEQRQRALERQMQNAQKLESLGVLAGGLAHDFNNLLMGVLGNAELLMEDLPANGPTRGMLEDIRANALRASKLSQQMLAYTGLGPVSLRRASLNAALESLIPLLQSLVPERGRLELKLTPNLPHIEADPEQLRQMVMTLAVNAAEAIDTRPGAITVATGRAACDAQTLALSPVRRKPAAGEFVWLEVRDTGCGMPPDMLDRVFDPFFTTKFTGRGMALAALLGIVQSHGGAVQVESTPGAGSTFRILFPLPNEQRRETAGETGLDPLERPNTILLVDGEAGVRAVGAEMLRRAGWDVATAGDGAEALQFIGDRGASVACVVLDLTMPHMNGERTIRELRRRSERVPILVSSGFDESLLAGWLEDWSVAGFIHKPYQREELVRKVNRAVEASAAVTGIE